MLLCLKFFVLLYLCKFIMDILGVDISEELIFKFIKFCVVGVSGTAIDFGLTYIFKEKLKMRELIANAIGFLIAATSNYFLNRIWTFQSQESDIVNQYFRFMIIALIGLGINSLILWIVREKFNKGFWFAKVIATGITLLWNFLGSKAFTFNK